MSRTRTHTRKKLSPGRVVAWAVLVVALFLTVFPFYWMVRTALTRRPTSTPTPPASSPTIRR
nr:hypothetical protein StreXyl84_00640 [Streptomyces sp. Xyl84]